MTEITEAVEWLKRRIAHFHQTGAGRDDLITKIETILSELTRLHEENNCLRLAICGGEDAPGYASSLPLETILKVAADNSSAWGEATDRATRLQEEVKGLRWVADLYDGEPTSQDIGNELADYAMILDNVGKAYDHVTGGRVSKANTAASAVIAVFDDHVTSLVEEEVAERLQAAKEEASQGAGEPVAWEDVARFLHDEVDLPDKFVDFVWPEHDGDDGYRGEDGWVKVQPIDIVSHYREAAKRLTARFYTSPPNPQARIEALEKIDALRADEGDSITLLCDNPDGPPNNAVVCCGGWTDWQERRFGGETLEAAIQAAFDARAALNQGADQ